MKSALLASMEAPGKKVRRPCSGTRERLQHIFIFSTAGKALVVKAGRTFEKLAENRLDDSCMASPAVAGDSLIIRTKTHLYRIGKK